MAQAGSVSAQPVVYGPDGLQITAPDGRFSAVVGFRNQLRLTTPFAEVPDEPREIDGTPSEDVRVNRSRLRLNGHVWSPRLKYQFQADFVEERIRDLSVTWEARPWLHLRAGRWKAEMNLERLQSSGAQQLVDRSILDRWFTLGRHQGVQVAGVVGESRPWGSAYSVGAFRGVDARGGQALPVWIARYEWRHAGRAVPLWQGDPERSRDLHLAIGSSVARAEADVAFYLGSGVGTTMPVLAPVSASERYRTRQVAGDVVAKWRGLSAQAELHRKHVRRLTTGGEQTLVGGYVMGGIVASALWARLPSALEFSVRYARVDPDITQPADRVDERVVGATWYLQRHRQKLTTDLSRLSFGTSAGVRETALRTRLQWEITF